MGGVAGLLVDERPLRVVRGLEAWLPGPEPERSLFFGLDRAEPIAWARARFMRSGWAAFLAWLRVDS